MRVKCLAQEHNKMTHPGLERGPLDPESSALTTRQGISQKLYLYLSEKLNYFKATYTCVICQNLPAMHIAVSTKGCHYMYFQHSQE